MPAAYVTSSASSPVDLLQKLATFLTNQGWTINANVADGASGGWKLHVNKGAAYMNFRANIVTTDIMSVSSTSSYTGIALNGSTGYDSTKSWSIQPGTALYLAGTGIAVSAPMPAGANIRHHFFDDGLDNIVVVVEKTTGAFVHFGFGTGIRKVGGWTGGAYFFGSAGFYNVGNVATSATCPFAYNASATAFVYGSAIDGYTGWVGCLASAAYSSNGNPGKVMASPVPGTQPTPSTIPHYGGTFATRQTSANGIANLLPLRTYLEYAAGGLGLFAEVPNLYLTNATSNGFAPATVMPIGAENYMLFPNFAVKKFA